MISDLFLLFFQQRKKRNKVCLYAANLSVKTHLYRIFIQNFFHVKAFDEEELLQREYSLGFAKDSELPVSIHKNFTKRFLNDNRNQFFS